MRTAEMKSSASKIVLDSYESLFGTDPAVDDPDKVRMIPLDELYPYYYLKYLLEKVPEYLDGTDRSFAEKLMPWTREYREYEKASILQDIHSSVPLSEEKPYYRPDQKYA